MPTQEYVCELEHVTEVRVGYDALNVMPCPECGQPAQKQSVYLIVPFTETGVQIGRLNPVPLDERRVKVSRFKEAAEEIDYQYNKADIPDDARPNYFRAGLHKAHNVAAGKEPPPKEKF